MECRTASGSRLARGALAVALSVAEPAMAAAAPAAPEPVQLEMATLAAMQHAQFEAELAGSGLYVAAQPDVQSIGASFFEVTSVAAKPLDLSRSGPLLRWRHTSNRTDGGATGPYGAVDGSVDVDLKTGDVQVSTALSLTQPLGAPGVPVLQGMRIVNHVAIPIERYREAAEASVQEVGFKRLADWLAEHEAEVSRTTVTGPNGLVVHFRGTELGLDDAILKVFADSGVPEAALQCTAQCVRRWGALPLPPPTAACVGGVAAHCRNTCWMGTIRGCVACNKSGLLQCGASVSPRPLSSLIGCLLGCGEIPQ